MEIAALVAWVLTAAGGLLLLRGWLSTGGPRRQSTKVTRFPAAVVLGHPVLAVMALGIWVIFLLTARTVYAWSALGVLVLVALLGFVLFTRWLTGEGKHARGGEREAPGVAVAAHGAVAILTFVLVLLSVVEVSRG